MTPENNIKNKILIILTGGTICSSENEKGERSSNAGEAQYKIVSEFRNSASPFNTVDFDYRTPLNILSENMTVNNWNTLLDDIKSIPHPEIYKGMIILHGTDTLAYTSSLLSLMLTDLELPVILVSSQLPLDKEGTNGNANFRAAVELIMNGIAPNVYAVYKNSDQNIYLHFGAHLKQCENYSDDFFSKTQIKLDCTASACCKGKPFETKKGLLNKLDELKPCVLYITPYVGIDYGAYNLDKTAAVVHNTYHSESVCVERSRRQGQTTNHSIIEFAKRCKEQGTDLFLAPCNGDAYAYESTGDALDNGAIPISSMTNEMAYVKTLTGCSLGYKGRQLADFINESCNFERL